MHDIVFPDEVGGHVAESVPVSQGHVGGEPGERLGLFEADVESVELSSGG